jgi:hypothetical protein
MKKTLIAAVLVALASGAVAQHHGHSPYAGAEKREIKALSEQQVADLRAGKGMGYALAAELNGLPGPIHVLELADRLGLSQSQRAKMQELFDQMKAEAMAKGEDLINKEAVLDRRFAHKHITPQELSKLTLEIGALQGELRAIHLSYHLATYEQLSAEQNRVYSDLRGYR